MTREDFIAESKPLYAHLSDDERAESENFLRNVATDEMIDVLRLTSANAKAGMFRECLGGGVGEAVR